MHLSLAILHKILFLWGIRLFHQNCIFQCQQIFNQLLLLLCSELTDVHAVGTICKGDRSRRLQEIPQLIIVNKILLQPTSRRFLRELDEAPGGNNLHYILQCLRVPVLVTRVWTRKVCRVAMECSWNDGSKTQYYVVILDRLPGRSRGLERAPEWHVRGPLTQSQTIWFASPHW